MRPNEKFSGSGHARHLCRECSKLGNSELQYQQDLRNLERLVTWEGIIGRKKRKAFNRFLEHPDPRIHHYAEELAAHNIEALALLRSLEDEDYSEQEDDHLEFESAAIGERPEDLCRQNETNGLEDDDIPF
jgi:hypothetical protein